MEALQYPIGRFIMPAEVSEEEITDAIGRISRFPPKILEAVQDLSPEQLDTPYRPGGWTVRQVVHHCADSHMNGYIRFKLALTEDHPTIQPYEESNWALLPDYASEPGVSLVLLAGLHKKWVDLMESMKPKDWQCTFYHPESKRTQTLAQTVMLYAWHGEHHLGHVKTVRK